MNPENLPDNTKRKLLKKGGLFVATLLTAPYLPPSMHDARAQNSPPEDSDEVTKLMIQEVQKLRNPNLKLGHQLSSLWQEGPFDYLAFQRVVYQRNRLTKEITLRNIMDDLSRLPKVDRRLASGEFGVTVPPHINFNDNETDFENSFEARIKAFKISRQIDDYARFLINEGLNPGTPTSPEKDYGPYTVTRFQRMALQYWKDDNRPEHVLVGYAAGHTGIIPEPAVLPVPIPIEEIQDQVISPCLGTGATWRGPATYYSHAGCLGCSRGQIMANGRPFKEMAHTIAFMRTTLGSIVNVTNLDNQQSVLAEVTDRGGFEAYGIIADLSLGTVRAINGGSRTNVLIELQKCA